MFLRDATEVISTALVRAQYAHSEAFRVGIRTAPRAENGHYPISAPNTYHYHPGMHQAGEQVWENALAQHPHLTDLFATQGFLTESQLDDAHIPETEEQATKRRKEQKVKCDKRNLGNWRLVWWNAKRVVLRRQAIKAEKKQERQGRSEKRRRRERKKQHLFSEH